VRPTPASEIVLSQSNVVGVGLLVFSLMIIPMLNMHAEQTNHPRSHNTQVTDPRPSNSLAPGNYYVITRNHHLISEPSHKFIKQKCSPASCRGRREANHLAGAVCGTTMHLV
jgi:hypothetical protein